MAVDALPQQPPARVLPSPVVILRHHATVGGREVRLADLADLSALPSPLRAAAARVVVARLPADRRQIQLSSSWVAERARATLPALSPWIGRPTRFAIQVRSNGTSASHAVETARPAGACVSLTRSLVSSTIVTGGDLAAAPCPTTSMQAAFRYDAAASAVRTARPLAAGDIAPAPPAFAINSIRPGDPVRLTATVGRVTIERYVSAAQPARAGKRLFVRGADGAVFAATPAGDPQ